MYFSTPPILRRLHEPYLRQKLKTASGPLMNIFVPPLAHEPVIQLVLRPARRRSTRQTDRKLNETTKISTLMIDVIPEPLNQTFL